jgi:hypothetical protein
MFKIIFAIICIAFYAHLYIHFIINPNNECELFQELTKEQITNAVYTKQPFVFDATTIKNTYILENKNVGKKYDSYDVSYTTQPILEPYVRFFPKTSVLECKKKKRWKETNNTCRTFYKIQKGTLNITCIHPKYKDLLSSKKELKENDQLIRLTLHPDSALFLPNYWYVYIDPLEDSILEKIQYYTPLNKVANAISTIFN